MTTPHKPFSLLERNYIRAKWLRFNEMEQQSNDTPAAKQFAADVTDLVLRLLDEVERLEDALTVAQAGLIAQGEEN